MSFNLDKLIIALSSAVVHAQHHVRQTNIGELSRYFKDDGTPIEVKLRIPRINPNGGRQEMMKVEVPLITLVNPKPMAIQEMQVTMSIDISAIAASAKAGETADEPAEKTSVKQYGWKAPETQEPVAASTATTMKKPGEPGMAQITLKVISEEVPEGLARFLGHINKIL